VISVPQILADVNRSIPPHLGEYGSIMIRLLRHRSKDDFELITFTSYDPPPYAILSHTWTDNTEVTYDELLAGTGKDKAGYAKIRFCGEQAVRDGLQYFWVDTCCIDKRNSTELQEAINSMFMWYKKANTCYAYLSDVTDANSVEGEESQFNKARWHSRGWTLQELLAPSNVNFYTHDWTFIGTKGTLCTQLSDITRIHVDILKGEVPISAASVAQRMSWASWRQTSRSEDIAYCLMGIFSVHMTMLYGEGVKAFLRLQEEICKESNDLSIFAWHNVDSVEDGRLGYGLLAENPRQFQNSWAVTSKDQWIDISNASFIAQQPLAMVNQGIQMKSYLLTLRSSRPQIKILILRCQTSMPCEIRKGYLGILVQERKVTGRGRMYVRLRSDILTLSKHRPQFTQEILLAKAGPIPGGMYKDLDDLQICRYVLGSVQPEKSGRLYLDMAPVYVSEGSLTSWRVVAWTAIHRLDKRIEPDERRLLGRITVSRDDGEQFVIRLAIRREDRAKILFPGETTLYSGEVSCLEESGSETWVAEDRRIDCGERNMVYVYANNLTDDTAYGGHYTFMDFTFLIRIRPSPDLDNNIKLVYI